MNKDKEDYARLILNNYYKKLLNYAYKYTSNWDEAQDITHDLILSFLDATYNSEKNINLSYLFKTLKYRCIDYLYKRKEIAYPNKAIEELQPDEEFYKSLEDSYIEGEVISTVNETLNSYTEKEIEIFKRNKYLEESISDIAQTTSISKYKISKTLNQIVGSIKKEIIYNFEEKPVFKKT